MTAHPNLTADGRLRSAERPAVARRRAGVPAPRQWGLRAADAYGFAALNALLVLAMWIRHGNLHELGSFAGTLTAAGQLAALYGALLALGMVLLVSRSPYLDQAFGSDRLLWLHRWGGFATVWLLVGHFVLTTAGWGLGDGSGIVGEFVTLVFSYPFVLWALVSLILFCAVAVSSVRRARRRLSYETWYGVHLYLYLAIALGFMHQLVVGSDFVDDPIARAYWIGLYVIALGSLVAWRIARPLWISFRHDLRVANVVPEAEGVVSIYFAGRDLDRLAAASGQWFHFRFLNRDGWWRAHPFSLSSAPNGRFLRIGVKRLGDYTAWLQRVPLGTRVAIEGPYGILTAANRTRDRVLMIAGGIGISPLRALLEDFPAAPGSIDLIYRCRRPEELAFRDELDALARLRGARVHYLVGRRGSPEMPADPLEPAALAALVPDVASRDVYVCGPDPMMEKVRSSLRALKVPPAQVHLERFTF